METLPTGTQKEKKGRKGCFKYFIYLILFIVLFGGVYTYWFYYNVFGDGVKSGILKNVVRKGQVFKTYEGELIQAGIKGAIGGGAQSNNFIFSVEDKSIYDTLSVHSGSVFDLHYKEYRKSLPWRGNTVYIVDSIIARKDAIPGALGF